MKNLFLEQYKRAYFKIILEQVLNDNSELQKLPSPFKTLFIHLKEAMNKAINATADKLKQINTQVNIWRDKILAAWKQFASKLTQEQKLLINNILLDLVTKYTTYMHGCNTGY